MRTAITIGIHHGGEKTSLIHGVELTVDGHRDKFKKLPTDESHETFERIEVWESDSGCVRFRKFLTKKASAEREASKKKQQEEHEKAKAAEANRNAGKTEEKADKKSAK